MARKTKKRPQPRPRRPVAPPAATPAVDRPAPRTGGDQALVRSVEMSLSPRAATSPRRGQRGISIGDDDPGIPLDRVPYFTSDLTKLAVVAAVMLVVLIAGAQAIPLVVK